ncbi:hypothetical protein DEA8626_02296 [Defluviimonas aquaemixtae]|uniref:DUF2867 domain-containing protein n=1 Tax=Albidovulum aquaemixtae TaxID=1542388 RepID=A0A2R8B8H9_9RHOB|nr:DUF2867 domain-containing protein [Defluviimonas aquaemixtae]SPH18753.1 hypothetical protein DEA8626_02296 [Defluviimonas aquaemixtae]
MARVERVELPHDSLLKAFAQPGDYLDSFACQSTLNVDQAAERAMNFPSWVTMLLGMRNLLVAPLGLIARPKGEKIGIFPLDQRSDSELVLGFDDRHLDFRVSVLVDGRRAFGSAWVHTHNLAGRAYLAAVLPFHVAIMRQAVARMAG